MESTKKSEAEQYAPTTELDCGEYKVLPETEKRRVMEMWNLITIPFIWIVAIIAYLIMKKIQPDSSKLYLVYVIFVCLAFTAVVILHVF